MNLKQINRLLLISIFSLALVLTATIALAKTNETSANKNIFDITSKLFIDGKLVSSPRIITHDNASIFLSNKEGSQELKIELIASNFNKNKINDSIQINYDIQCKNGGEEMHSKPQIVVAPNTEGKISFSSNSGHTYKMYVIAKRV